jgi:hypothetical protein
MHGARGKLLALFLSLGGNVMTKQLDEINFLLQHGLLNANEHEAANAFSRMRAKVKKHNIDPHEIAITMKGAVSRREASLLRELTDKDTQLRLLKLNHKAEVRTLKAEITSLNAAAQRAKSVGKLKAIRQVAFGAQENNSVM